MRILFQSFFIAIALFCSVAAFASSEELLFSETLAVRQKSLEEARTFLAQTKQNIEIITNEQKNRLSVLRADDVDINLIEQSRLDLEAAHMGVESTDVDLQGLANIIKMEETAIQQLQRQIQILKSATGDNADAARREQLPTLEMELTNKEKLLDLERARLDLLQQLLKVAQQRERLASEWSGILQNHFNVQQRRSLKEALEQIRSRFQEKIKEQQEKIAEWQNERGSLVGDSTETVGKRQLIEWRIHLAEERVRLYQMEIRVAGLRNQRGQEAEKLPVSELSSAHIQIKLDDLVSFQTDSEVVLTLLQRKEEVLRQLLSVTEKRQTTEWLKSLQKKDIQGLIQSYGSLAKTVLGLYQALLQERQEVEKILSTRIRADLLTRQTLPSTVQEWQALGSDLATFPEELWKKITAAFEDFSQGLTSTASLSLAYLLFLEACWLGFWLWIRLRLTKIQSKFMIEDDISFGRSATLRVASLIQKNFWMLYIAFGLTIAVAFIGQTPPGNIILYTLIIMPPAIGIGMQLMRYMLIEFNPEAGDVHIRRFRFVGTVFFLGSLYAGMMILTHAIIFSPPLQDLFDRTFMVFLFMGIIPVFGLRQGTMDGLAERLGEGYWMQIIQLLSLVVPIAFLVAAAIGLAGFVNMGWAACKYISWLILVFIAWSILHGLWDDLAVILKNRINLKFRNGLFWIQGVIDPIHRTGRLFLFIGAWFSLFFLYGWDIQSKPAQLLVKVWSFVLFDWGKTPIHVSDLILLIFLVSAFVWLSQIVRQFTFRMMSRKVSDVGIRHSLSVFAQYGVVILGFLFTLRYMGIDLTNLAILAGALGVGMGFGLQNVANNFVSGLLLLVERPIRTGDIIKVAEKEGEVTKIGIRAVTVKTWDNHEVIIPNSEIASNSFTNWTHSNFVVRTLLYIGVHYNTDPHHAIRVIWSVLKENKLILEAPKPVVWLCNFAASSVEIHVHYFTDWRVQRPNAVKSGVLLRIWDRFKEENIQIPYPQQDLYLKEVPEAWQQQEPMVKTDTTDAKS
ncbi:MAG: mechanosensitive ion channel [Magnetococcales bacterium]|nr:mechanosensitive ion channel [Magnetococcales bacterium]